MALQTSRMCQTQRTNPKRSCQITRMFYFFVLAPDGVDFKWDFSDWPEVHAVRRSNTKSLIRKEMFHFPSFLRSALFALESGESFPRKLKSQNDALKHFLPLPTYTALTDCSRLHQQSSKSNFHGKIVYVHSMTAAKGPMSLPGKHCCAEGEWDRRTRGK